MTALLLIIAAAVIIAWIHADRIARVIGILAGGAAGIALGLVTVVFRIGGHRA